MAHDETTDEEPTIRYISLFSGIEACSVAWTNLNWECVAVADFDDFPSAVLAERYPKVPNLKDITKVDWNDYNRKADLVVGGSPCQSFSVAGKRLGMDDPRGNLAIEFLRVVEAVQPKWFIFENVAGLLSSDGGRDFAHFLSMVGELGYGYAYRVLDAQWFGVPQRRRRVFVVGSADGDWRSAASVLFESDCLRGNPKTSKEAREDDSTTIGRGFDEAGFGEDGFGGMTVSGGDVVETLRTAHGIHLNRAVAHHEDGEKVMYENHPTDSRITPAGDVSPTITARHGTGGGNVPLVKHDFLYGVDYEPDSATKNDEEIDSFGLDMTKTRHETVGTVCARVGNTGDQDHAIVHTFSQDMNTMSDEVMGTMTTREGVVSDTAHAVFHTDVDDGVVAIQEPSGSASAKQNGSGISTDGQSYTLTARGVHGVGQPISIQDADFIRKDGGKQYGVGLRDDGKSFTLTRTGVHGVGQPIEEVISEDVMLALDEEEGDYEGWAENQRNELRIESNAVSGTVVAGMGKNMTRALHKKTMVVRRLMPIECERLQGFPDNWTKVSWRGKPADDCPDGHRYKACGNSMAVPVMKWIGEGIDFVHKLNIVPPTDDVLDRVIDSISSDGTIVSKSSMDKWFD